MKQRNPIPAFYLYGEPHRQVSENFVHIEPLDHRSRPNSWIIRPHSHRDLCHIFLLSSGGGVMKAEETMLTYKAPAFLVIPAGAVHGFDWLQETAGTVITMATRYVADLAVREPCLNEVFDAPQTVLLDTDDDIRATEAVATLNRELAWSAPGHRAAVDASILSLLVMALRKRNLLSPQVSKPGAHLALVARLRGRIEERFRLREPVSEYAAALGVSETALRLACRRIAGSSPTQMLDERALLEARRSLLYSNLTVAEIAYALGFADPAYFSRFFSRYTGVSPRHYRHPQGR